MLSNRMVFLAASVVVLAPAAATAQGGERVPSTEWEVPFGGRPRDPYVAPDGSVWFVGQEGNYIGRLDARSGDL